MADMNITGVHQSKSGYITLVEVFTTPWKLQDFQCSDFDMEARIQNPRVQKDLTISLSLVARADFQQNYCCTNCPWKSTYISNNRSWNPAILVPLLYRENAVGRATDRQVRRRAVPFGPQNQLGIAPPFVRTLFAHQIRQSLQQPFVGIGLQPLPPALWNFPCSATQNACSPCRFPFDSPFSGGFQPAKCTKKITSMKQPSGVSPYFVESNPQKPPSESSQPQVAQRLVRLCRHLLAAAGLVLLDVEAGLGPHARLLDVERIDAAVEGVAGGHQVVGIQRLHLLIGKPRNGLEPRIKIFGGKCWWNDLDDYVEFNKIEIAVKTVYIPVCFSRSWLFCIFSEGCHIGPCWINSFLFQGTQNLN